MVPGSPFANFLRRFKQMGDGTGNESGMIEMFFWATVFGIILWAITIIGGIWAWNNLSISFSLK
ncbi:MAG: hypothetical protein Q8R55_02715 [Candidatus Taylorbacteria bacterium]|nr:hypothetical protein [Candidatus Taylorbacteria bacterium]